MPQRSGPGRLVGPSRQTSAPGTVVERTWVGPALGERGRNVTDGRSANLELEVMPCRARTVSTVDQIHLGITKMAVVVIATMAEIDTADEGYVIGRIGGMTDHEQLLVVASGPPNSLVEQNLAATVVHRLREVGVLLFAEVGAVGMRPPDEAAHLDAGSGHSRQHRRHFSSRTGEALVEIASPIREMNPVARPGRDKSIVEAGEVRCAIAKHRTGVADRPGQSAVAIIYGRRRITPFGGVEKPGAQLHAGGQFETATGKTASATGAASSVDVGPKVGRLEKRRVATKVDR